MQKKQRLLNKRRYFILTLIILTIVFLAFSFVQFTKEGYRMTVPLRRFDEIESDVYIHKDYLGETDEVLEVIEAAKARVANYFGEIRSRPVIIICDDEKVLEKLGGDHDTSTVVLFNAYSYISLSSEYFNTDILAHELTHAEVHARLYKGKIGTQSIVPIWFDEGIALQNYYRDTYNYEAWLSATDNGSNLIDFDEIDTAAEFYAGTIEERRYRYIISRHEVETWVEEHEVQQLFDLLEAVNRGNDFNQMYFTFESM